MEQKKDRSVLIISAAIVAAFVIFGAVAPDALNDVANVRFSVKGLDARAVARYAFDKAQSGKMVIIPGFGMKAVKFFSHFIGERALTRISYNVQSRKDGK